MCAAPVAAASPAGTHKKVLERVELRPPLRLVCDTAAPQRNEDTRIIIIRHEEAPTGEIIQRWWGERPRELSYAQPAREDARPTNAWVYLERIVMIGEDTPQ